MKRLYIRHMQLKKSEVSVKVYCVHLPPPFGTRIQYSKYNSKLLAESKVSMRPSAPSIERALLIAGMA